MRSYAAFHRDRRNVLSHWIGIPLVILSVFIPLAYFRIELFSVSVSLASLFLAGVLFYYLFLDVVTAIAVAPFTFFLLWVAIKIADKGAKTVILCFIITAAIGWTFQLIGHRYEGKKPAFLSDLSQLLNGPLFLGAKLTTMSGHRSALKRALSFDKNPPNA